MFNHAITRLPGHSLVRGISTAGLGCPDYTLALAQHKNYVKALESCGVMVSSLEAAEDFPDAVFVEDAALCTPHCGIVTRPAAASRRGEAALMEPVLKRFYDCIERIDAPGTLDAGDVMMVGTHYVIGVSLRTNGEGARQLSGILKRYDLSASTVILEEVLHLKTGLSYLEHNNLLVAGEFTDHPAFERFERVEVPPEESYAANSVWLNDRVIMPAGYPLTLSRVADLGYEVIEVDVSEFRKIDGGVSCLSLRF